MMDPSLLLLLPAHRHALACCALRSPAAAALLRALVTRSRMYARHNAQCAALLWLEYRTSLLAPASLRVHAPRA